MSKNISTSFLMLSLVLCNFANAEPLYWTATKGDKELMILGSVHMGKPEMYPLPEAVMDFLQQSKALILEVDLDNSPSPNLNLQNQELSENYIDNNQKEKLKQIASELNLNSSVLLSQPTWQTALILQLAYFSKIGYQEEWGIDSYLSTKAQLKSIPIVGLETVEFQLSLFTQDKRVGRELLDGIINEWDKNKEVSDCLKEDWLSGDKLKLSELADEMGASPSLADALIYKRNRDWSEKLDSVSFLESNGKYLVVVGALHLVGKENLITLLKQRGFTVNQQSHSTSSQCW